MPPTDTAPKPSPAPRETQIDASAKAPTAWGRGRRIVTAGLAVLVVIAAAGTWYLASEPPPADVRPTTSKDGSYTPGSLPSDAGAAAVRAASDLVPTALSYDYRTLDDNLKQATEGMSPSFAETFTTTFTSAVEPMATKNKAVTKALVRGAGLAALTDDNAKATCVLFVDQILVTSEGAGKTQPRIGKERVLASMINIDGIWLIDDIRPF